MRVLWQGYDSGELADAINEWLGAGDAVVFCVGNILRGDDAFGPATARLLWDSNIRVFDCSVSPEAYVGKAVSMGATHVIMVDAVQADCPPGTLFLFEADDPSISLETCHRGSTGLISKFLWKNGVHMAIVGAQVGSQVFGESVSPEVMVAAGNAARGIRLALGG